MPRFNKQDPTSSSRGPQHNAPNVSFKLNKKKFPTASSGSLITADTPNAVKAMLLRQPINKPSYELYDRSYAFVFTVGKKDVVQLPPKYYNLTRYQECRNFAETGSCEKGIECKFVHLRKPLETFPKQELHVSYAWRSTDAITYPCLSNVAGAPCSLTVEFPELPFVDEENRTVPAAEYRARNRAAADACVQQQRVKTVSAAEVIVTRGVEALLSSAVSAPVTVCSDYFLERMCKLGAKCPHAHVACIDATARDFQRAPSARTLRLELMAKEQEQQRSASTTTTTTAPTASPGRSARLTRCISNCSSIGGSRRLDISIPCSTSYNTSHNTSALSSPALCDLPVHHWTPLPLPLDSIPLPSVYADTTTVETHKNELFTSWCSSDNGIHDETPTPSFWDNTGSDDDTVSASSSTSTCSAPPQRSSCSCGDGALHNPPPSCCPFVWNPYATKNPHGRVDTLAATVIVS